MMLMVLTRVLNGNIVYLAARVECEHNIFPILNVKLYKVVEVVIGIQQQGAVIVRTQVQKDILTQEL